MPNCELDIRIEDDFAGLLNEEWLGRVVEKTLSTVGMNKPVVIGLFIAGDDTVHELNRNYRGIDSTTDVLAFAFSESETSKDGQFITPPDAICDLGEVIISYPRAEKQALEQHHSLEHELALLVSHGILHLLGYDHEQIEDEEIMRALEARILDTLKNDMVI
ncbi:MAG: rRNA maturation RNase YbeY [Dehalococcoidia bacterium]|nr:rRNA maturation RNase YbeY [Dehalococcoidia bacterium]